MGNLKVTMTDVDGNVQTFDDVPNGITLMELGRDKDVAGMTGECGGACACATCHVYIDPAWWDKVGAPDDIELAMLDMVADVMTDKSRLSCQIRMTPELDGVVVTIAPESEY
jgi:2Fe-2S ferredoxin